MFNLLETTISDIQAAYASGELTALELTLRYLERIADIDQSGPNLNSVLEINPDALDIAEALDREYTQTGPRSPLHGIPVLIKDNINTCDKMHTSAGSLALADNYAPFDAHIVTRLREAGAIILGKANLTELANFLTAGMRNGFSSRGGAVLNPYGADLNVGGSSAGSGAAVSANLCAIAVGTETSGSILCPANWNGVVGVKPTKGLLSRTGIIPICTAQDTAGPLTRTVADAAALLTVLAGTDPEDRLQRPSILIWKTTPNILIPTACAACASASAMPAKNAGRRSTATCCRQPSMPSKRPAQRWSRSICPVSPARPAWISCSTSSSSASMPTSPPATIPVQKVCWRSSTSTTAIPSAASNTASRSPSMPSTRPPAA